MPDQFGVPAQFIFNVDGSAQAPSGGGPSQTPFEDFPATLANYTTSGAGAWTQTGSGILAPNNAGTAFLIPKGFRKLSGGIAILRFQPNRAINQVTGPSFGLLLGYQDPNNWAGYEMQWETSNSGTGVGGLRQVLTIGGTQKTQLDASWGTFDDWTSGNDYFLYVSWPVPFSRLLWGVGIDPRGSWTARGAGSSSQPAIWANASSWWKTGGGSSAGGFSGIQDGITQQGIANLPQTVGMYSANGDGNGVFRELNIIPWY